MKQIVKYLFFILFLAVALFVATNFDLPALFAAKTSKSVGRKNNVKPPSLSKRPNVLLTGLTGQVTVDYSPAHNLTVAAADDVIMVWQLPDTVPLHEIDGGEGFQALSVRFVPATSLVVAGGMTAEHTGSIGIFDAATGTQKLQIEEPEPIWSLDPHPGGKYILATAETYIKVIDMKDGNSVAILQKNNPASRAYYYGNGQYVIQSDSLSLFDLQKRSVAGTLDPVTPLLFKKNLDGTTFAWVSAGGVSVVTAAQNGKKFYPLDTKGIVAFDVESHGEWGLFLLDTQKVVLIELSSGKIITSIDQTTPVSDVTISPDGSAAYVHYSSGTIAVYDIGFRNKIRSARFGLKRLFNGMKNKLGPVAKPEP